MSFQIGLSGLNSALSSLRTTSNNIANASTKGFKASRTEFADVIATSTGAGVRVASVSQQFNQGSVLFTNNPLDLAIVGQGLFRLNSGGETVYSRSGAFHLDREGYIVNEQNERLTGYLADNTDSITNILGDIRIDASSGGPAATSTVDLNLNLDSRETPPITDFNANNPSSYNHATSTTIVDSAGNQHQLEFYFRQTANPNQVELRVYENGNEVLGATTLAFSTTGTLQTPASPTNITIPSFNLGNGAADLSITLDVAGITHYGSRFAVSSLSQNGFGSGNITSITINQSGMIRAQMNNGQSRTIGQIATADFTNTQGLKQLGNGNYSETYASGAALLNAPNSGNQGFIQSGALEDSNVNISEQLIALKLNKIQVQINAKTIQTSSDIIGTLLDELA